MKNCNPASQSSDRAGLPFPDYLHACRGWLIHGEINRWSPRTLEDRRVWVDRLSEFLQSRELDFSVDALRLYFLALGQGNDGRSRKPLRPASLKHVHSLLSALGAWCIEEGLLAANPMKRVPSPRIEDDRQKQFADNELLRLLDAARNSRNGSRDLALIVFLADTGVRASELTDLRVQDVDLTTRTALIRRGKGGKLRSVGFGKDTAQTLWRYLRGESRDKDEHLFQSERGGPMTRGSLLQLCRRLGKVAGVEQVHPHRFRHDACVRLLRGGANLFQTMMAMGHTRAATTQIYVKLAEQDLRNAYAIASPMDNLKKRQN